MRIWQPWTRSTGPRTAEGKARSSRNAWKGGVRKDAAHWSSWLRALSKVGRAAETLVKRKQRPVRNKPDAHFKSSPDVFSDWLSSMEQMTDSLIGTLGLDPGGG